jgi:uncharacterized protein (TIGR00297 family)
MQFIHRLSREMCLPVDALALGVLLASVVGWLAFRAGALTSGGALAATVLGTLTFGFGGINAALLLIFFFVTSSLLSRFRRKQKEAFLLGFAKGGCRDASQVVANGGVALICMCLYAWNGSRFPLMGFVGAIAVATADTWATEIGVLSREQTRSILTGRVVLRGTSGGVTALGMSASLVGAAVIGGLGYFVLQDLRSIPLGLLGGIVGAIFDSLLGARWQVMYRCPSCGTSTERHPIHHCGTHTHYERGLRWMDNDLVNFLATCIGAGTSILVGASWM